MVDHRVRTHVVRLALSASLLLGVAGCSSGDSSGSDTGSSDAGGAASSAQPGGSADSAQPVDADLVRSVRQAIEAVDAELGGPQQYFEVTATLQLTNVFVAIDDATAAVPYVFIDNVLEAPGPTLEGVSGQTFRAGDLNFDEALILRRIATELPTATIVSLSVEGSAAGAPRYTASARSPEGGVLDIVVGPTGEILSVEPI